MRLERLELTNFRCHKNLKVTLQNQNCLIIGNNGIGKTSLLEAIHIGLSSKSFKTNHIQEVISDDELYSKILLNVNKDTFVKHLIAKNKRSIMINEKLVAKTSQFIEKYPVVCFNQRDYNFFFTTPANRRDFLDFEIVKIDSSYQKLIFNYQKIIKQRNALLKKMKPDDDPVFLNILNQTLFEFGEQIITKRLWFCTKINESLKLLPLYNSFPYHFELEYLPNATQSVLKRQLFTNYKRDILLQSTSYGPHRDDLKIICQNQDASTVFSAGEQKLSIYLLRLAILQVFQTIKQMHAIFLIDDVFAELDDINCQKIITNLPSKIQSIITTTINYNLNGFQIINLNEIKNKEVK